MALWVLVAVKGASESAQRLAVPQGDTVFLGRSHTSDGSKNVSRKQLQVASEADGSAFVECVRLGHLIQNASTWLWPRSSSRPVSPVLIFLARGKSCLHCP